MQAGVNPARVAVAREPAGIMHCIWMSGGVFHRGRDKGSRTRPRPLVLDFEPMRSGRRERSLRYDLCSAGLKAERPIACSELDGRSLDP